MAVSQFLVIIEQGAEYAPESPRGQETLVLSEDGRLRHYHRHQGRLRCWEAHSRRGVGQVVKHLEVAGFPIVPDGEDAPLSSRFRLTVRVAARDVTAVMCTEKAAAWEGYAEIISLAQAWLNAFRPHPSPFPFEVADLDDLRSVL